MCYSICFLLNNIGNNVCAHTGKIKQFMVHTYSGVLHWKIYFNWYGVLFRIHCQEEKQSQRNMYSMFPFVVKKIGTGIYTCIFLFLEDEKGTVKQKLLRLITYRRWKRDGSIGGVGWLKLIWVYLLYSFNSRNHVEIFGL